MRSCGAADMPLRVTTRRINAHRLIAIRRKEQMAMVGSHDGVFDARCGKLADRSRQVVYHRVHYLPGLEREARLAGVVDLLRADHDDLGAFVIRALLDRYPAAKDLVEDVILGCLGAPND